MLSSVLSWPEKGGACAGKRGRSRPQRCLFARSIGRAHAVAASFLRPNESFVACFLHLSCFLIHENCSAGFSASESAIQVGQKEQSKTGEREPGRFRDVPPVRIDHLTSFSPSEGAADESLSFRYPSSISRPSLMNPLRIQLSLSDKKKQNSLHPGRGRRGLRLRLPRPKRMGPHPSLEALRAAAQGGGTDEGQRS